MSSSNRSARGLKAIALVATIGAACASPSGGSHPDCSLDAPPHVTHDGSVLLFAMTRLEIDPSDSLDRTHTGFDLDGLTSTETDLMGCSHADALSVLDPESNCADAMDGRCRAYAPRCNCPDSLDLTPPDPSTHQLPCVGSIDNQFPAAASTIQITMNTDLNAQAEGSLHAGQLIVLVRVTGVDAFDEDADVRVQLFRGFTAPGEPCTLPAMGATYQIDATSLRTGGTSPDDSAVDLAGSIHNGRLRVAATDTRVFTLLWPSSGTSLTLPSHQATLAMDLSADGGSRGNFGAWVSAEDLLETFAVMGIGDLNFTRGVIAGLVDIEVGGFCDGRFASPPGLGGVSYGFGFDAVRVQLDATHPVVDAPMPGTCSAPSHGDAGRD